MPDDTAAELILDDWEDEFATEDSDNFQQCVVPWYCGQNFLFPKRVHVLSSVDRPLSEAFWICTMQDIKELYIKG